MDTFKKISEIEAGEKIILINTDDNSTCLAVLRDGGQSGGCKHDMWLAYMGEPSDSDYDYYPQVCTDSAECDDCEISI